jgi:hypothetical protein
MYIVEEVFLQDNILKDFKAIETSLLNSKLVVQVFL